MTRTISAPRPAVERETTCRLDHSLALAYDKIDHLEHALETSRQIGAAVGVLMAMEKLTYDDAFRVLRRASQDNNVKVRDLALLVLEQGCIPSALERVH